MDRLTSWNGKKWILPQGRWREIAERLAAYENTGFEPEEITVLSGLASANCSKTADAIDRLLAEDDEPAEPLGDILSAVIVVREKGGNVPYIDPVDCCARLYTSEIAENADNPEVIRERGANHLVIEVYADHWHVSQVGGYSPDGGLFTKLY